MSVIVCNDRPIIGRKSTGKIKYGAPCKQVGTERFMSTWYCRQHLPIVDPNTHCSHSLAPSGQCAYCGMAT